MPTCRPSLRFIGIIAIISIAVASAFAQHDSTGGTAGGGSLGPSKPKTTTKPTTTRTTTSTRKTTTPTTTTTPRRTTTTPTTTTTPRPTTSTVNADFYEKQADVQYDAKNYNEALQGYLKVLEMNPSSAHSNYRVGWIYNDQEQ